MRTLTMAGVLLAAMATAGPVLAQPAQTSPQVATPDAPSGNRMRDAMQALSPAGRTLMTAALRAQSKAGRADQQQLRAVRLRILDAMAADPFNAATLREAYVEERALAARLQDQRQEALVDAFTQLSAADRRAMAGFLRALDVRVRDRARLKRGGQVQDTAP